MIHFFDTSALVKLFSVEPGAGQVKEIIMNPSNDIWVLELALVELLSAVYRKYRNHEVPEENLERIQKAIEQQFEFFTIIPIGADVIEESKSLIIRYGKDYGLRTLDAMHIAGWNVIVEPDSIFVSSDKNQLQVVSLMNYQTISV
ncbi:MAG: type II toxin-antitoxin system VapC family toxin [Bacteroidales bacterium]|nr:type II toxin-antitoxin system VapC family toxin [Bacteroidales bacterium]